MGISPRYGGEPIIAIAGAPRDQLEPLSRQRRRLEVTLEALAPRDWAVPSRCTGWSIHDVVAHLAGVNGFWTTSVRAGLEGAPTRFLANFDPVATPELLVAPMRELAPEAVLELFVSSNDEFLALLGTLDDGDWAAPAETPPGDLPIRLLASHALWDAWVHERDVVLPLGRHQPQHRDEVGASLRYVGALTAALSLLAGSGCRGTFGVDAEDPVTFVLDVGDHVVVRESAPRAGDPTLRGDAASLVDALSTRSTFRTAPPSEWDDLLRQFAMVFAPQT